MKLLVIVFILLFALSGAVTGQRQADTLKPDPKKAIDIIEHYGGFFFNPGSRVWNYYLEFSRALADKDLVDLTDNWNPATRCYALFALAEKHSPVVDSILQAHLLDTALVFVLLGDDGDHKSVGDFFYGVLTDHFFKGVVQLDSPEKAFVDSLIINRTGIRLEAKSDLLRNMPPKDAWYNRIREIATVENNNSAVVALSKYRKAQDLTLIEDLLKNPDRNVQYLGLLAARNYPDPALFPYIRQIHQIEIHRDGGFDYVQIRMLYQAIVQYKDSASRQLLLETLKKAKSRTLEYHSEDIWGALTRWPDPIYDNILSRLKIPVYAFPELSRTL
ncbi:MAG TPA: hypothetical protein VK563_17920 [Puia sp.]|nr:hypothetical protein [Puia sp.]